jgi:hypothetical protein
MLSERERERERQAKKFDRGEGFAIWRANHLTFFGRKNMDEEELGVLLAHTFEATSVRVLHA